MSVVVENPSLEAEIADCCREMYWATEPEVVISNWARLRKLTAEKAEADRNQFIRETKNLELTNTAPRGDAVPGVDVPQLQES